MIYLDHAATSFPKPPAVLAAIEHWYRAIGVSPARGDGALCRIAAQVVAQARAGVAALCGVRTERVAFTSGATESANLFLRGLLQPGDRVVTTAAEHSAIARPLRAMQAERNITCDIVPVDSDGYVRVDEIARALRQGPTRLVALNHASNVTGAVQDAAAICTVARSSGSLVLLDASQTAGVLPLASIDADACIASAHKSLLGPPGLGFLAVREHVALAPAKQGGTGSSAALDQHPVTWPTGFEAGTPNGPAIAGLLAALRFLDERGIDSLHAHSVAVSDAVRAGLAEQLGPAVRLLGRTDRARIGVLSFTLRDLDPAEAGVVFDAAGIHLRTGFHCAPWIHANLGTAASGTIRISAGPFVTADEALAVVRALAR